VGQRIPKNKSSILEHKMPHVTGLRSPYDKVGRLVFFGRMLDKIRLHAAGKLPAEYVADLGDQGAPTTFDARCCRFLGVAHAALSGRVLSGGSDEEILAWAHANGTPRTDEECEIWNMFLSKRGWRDAITQVLQQRIEESGLIGKPILTNFDFLDYDEGRDSGPDHPWERI
jgi:hypothetical protein